MIATHHFSMELVQTYLPAWIWPVVRLVLHWWLHRLYVRCQLVTTPSEKTASDIRPLVGDTPIVVLSNGVALHQFSQPVDTAAVRQRFSLTSDEPVLLFVGRLDPDKSVDELIRILAITRVSRPIQLVLVGDGNCTNPLRRLAYQLGVGDAVTFTGWLAHDDAALPGLFQLADLFVIASTIETQGIVVIEAMAAGLPVVAANANALPELVSEGKTGRLVEPGNGAAFAEAILDLLNRPKVRQSMKRHARRSVQRHEQTHCLEQFLAAYQQLVLAQPSAQPIR